MTDGVDSYRFDNVPAGSAELTIRLINFSMVRRTVNVTAGAAVQANAVMLVATSADIVVTAPRTFRNLAEIENPGGRRHADGFDFAQSVAGLPVNIHFHAAIPRSARLSLRVSFQGAKKAT